MAAPSAPPSQERKGGLVMPYLQMQDAAGRWMTVNEDMGMPAGKPKTIAVPVALHFGEPQAPHRHQSVRLLGRNLPERSRRSGRSAPDAGARCAPPICISADSPNRASTRSANSPIHFSTTSFALTSFWNPTPGLYTRYGDVRELARRRRRSPGDHGLRRRTAPAVRRRLVAPSPAGWTRDFLLKVDGWAKDRDPNTAFSQTVEPLPFHGMSRYPYPATEHFPDDDRRTGVIQRDYNTRPALRLIRPLRWSDLMISVSCSSCCLPNAAYVAALPAANLFYIANVLLHLVLGCSRVRRG